MQQNFAQFCLQKVERRRGKRWKRPRLILNIIKPSAKADAEHEIDDFISNWKLLATQSKGLRYYVYTTKTYNRLMNTYGEVCTDLEKPTLRSMRDVESAANMFYYTED